MTDTDTPEARPEDLALALSWQDEDGALKGALTARNVGAGRVRLSGKPSLTPLDPEGNPLETGAVISLELKMPDYVDLGPGESATADVGWAGWDGPAAGGRVLVRWRGGQAEVAADGPRQPSGSGPATNLWSSWFVRTAP